ncbi:Uncharacterized protein PECH_004949 [Penicillium ucsense]|uniref:G protein-coupled receptor GPR1/2/3 C-terminal domain-containing protein n=1 Tax=Penicillium ucsense TaxID=2839758 RepID=A0A8J8WHI0_9EURO|nr:Uncharacterized protein PECM_008286 [Penicillium ucsense]KAF7736740.1 Uncharacterized protein PECH_004949 [Penicillium ucsense]
MVMLMHLLGALYLDGAGQLSVTRRWEFSEETPLTGLDRSLFIMMGVVALLSLVSTIGLLTFLTHRFIFWQRYYKHPLAHNQYVVLIYNLLLVDLQQAIAFVICLYWVGQGRVHFGEIACYLQGWWIQTADPGSGLFVLWIALHTSAVVLRGRQLPFKVFICFVIGLWAFILILGVIPVSIHGSQSFVITEANWCWLSPANEHGRFWGHYFWIFSAEFGTVILYTILFICLRRRMAQAKMLRIGQQESLHRLNRVVIYMVIYPFIYLVLSLPLAAGRMATARGHPPGKTYFAVAGSFMALSGVVDVAVYALTRRHLLLDTEHRTTDRIYDNTISEWHTQITTTAVPEDRPRKQSRLVSKISSKLRRSENREEEQEEVSRKNPFDDSTDDIVPKSDVELSTFTVETWFPLYIYVHGRSYWHSPIPFRLP